MRRTALLVFSCLALGLTACSGGLFIGYDSTRLGPPPSITLNATPAAFTQAGVLTLSTSITASQPIVEVRFYQIVGGSSVFLATRTADPFQLTLFIDRTRNGTLEFFATAIDAAGLSTDSNVVSIAVSIP